MSLFTEENGTLGLVLEDTYLQNLLNDASEQSPPLQEVLSKHTSLKIREFIHQYHNVNSHTALSVLKTSTSFNVDQFPPSTKSTGSYDLMINLKHINDTLYINKLFKSFNSKLSVGGTFIGCVETYQLRKRRILKKYPAILNYIYYTFDYLFKRVFPKIKFLDKIYFFFTAGRNRAISQTEALGRLNYCGFKVMGTIVDKNLMYFAVTKVELINDVKEKDYRVFLKLPRKGKNGRSIKVYKLRSMFPYAEYIQEYVYKLNKLQEGGKFQNDFRISKIGRFFRKYFLDEIPMIINLLKGDLKLVGVRPLSKHYFELYDEDFRSYRIKYKPGLIPPYYVDFPKTLKEIQDSEKKYLQSYQKSPLATDFKYFFLAMRNIIFKKARSK